MVFRSVFYHIKDFILFFCLLFGFYASFNPLRVIYLLTQSFVKVYSDVGVEEYSSQENRKLRFVDDSPTGLWGKDSTCMS